MSSRGLRFAAKQAGRKTYFSGIPCPQGHIAERSVRGACRECSRLNCERRRRARGVKRRTKMSHAEFLAKRRKIMRSWRDRNRATYRAIANKRYKRHRARLRVELNERFALRRTRTVGWADKKAVRAIYREARRLTRSTGIQHHVDHIVPLISPTVCGLHWEGNLQVLTGVENCKKRNLFSG